MGDVNVSQARLFAVVSGANIEVSESRVFAVINYPAEQVQASQVTVQAIAYKPTQVEVSQARVFAVVRGRIENRRLRAWTFSLDGHDFYVLRLGETETLVYDLLTGQWFEWNSPGLSYWRAHLGAQWIGMGKAVYDQGFESNVVAGDDTFGLLWILSPERALDQHPDTGVDQPFPRIVTGGLPVRMRDMPACYAAYVTMSVGEPAQVGSTITLRTSDDQGRTYVSHGEVVVEEGQFFQEIAWRSLGLMQAPGRIFEIEDDGAAARIDSLDVELG